MPDFKAQMQQSRFPLGLRRWGAYNAPPDPVAVFEGQGEGERKRMGKIRNGN